MKTKRQIRTQADKIVAVKAAGKKVAGKDLFFLFTVSQVEEVLSDISIQPVPFAPPFLAGIFSWRGHVVPVLDIEDRFGFPGSADFAKNNFIVVRTGGAESSSDKNMLRCVLRVSRRIHTMEISNAYSLVDVDRIDVNPSLVRGAFQLEENFFIVPDLGAILQNKE